MKFSTSLSTQSVTSPSSREGRDGNELDTYLFQGRVVDTIVDGCLQQLDLIQRALGVIVNFLFLDLQQSSFFS